MQEIGVILMEVATGCSGSDNRGVQSNARGRIDNPSPWRRYLRLQWWRRHVGDALNAGEGRPQLLQVLNLASEENHPLVNILVSVLLSRLQG